MQRVLNYFNTRKMKKIFLMTFLAALTLPIFAQTIDDDDYTEQGDSIELLDMDSLSLDSILHNLTFELRGDTLYVRGGNIDMPRTLTIVTDNATFPYRQAFAQIIKSENIPADSIYKHIWTAERVNPYATPVDSLRDSILIDCKEAVSPVKSYITSRFGPRRYRYHYGTDIKVQIGDSVRAAFPGTVRIVNYDAKGYGYYVVVRHTNGLETVYGHFSRPLVDENETVSAGDVVGLGGNTGRSTGSHLHFETRYLGNPFNPELIFDFENGLCRSDSYLITKAGTYKYKKSTSSNGSTNYSGAQYYKIRRGDNLSKIAQKYGTSVKRLCSLNGIKSPDKIREGQRIRVR